MRFNDAYEQKSAPVTGCLPAKVWLCKKPRHGLQDIKAAAAKAERGITKADLQSFFSAMSYVRAGVTELPADAHWLVLHPDTRFMRIWVVVIYVAATWFFFEVPWNIAFQVAHRIGALQKTIAILQPELCFAQSVLLARFSRIGRVQR